MLDKAMPQQPIQQPSAQQQSMPVQPPQQEPAAIQEDPQKTAQVEGALVNEDEIELGKPQELQLEAYKDNATLVVFSESSQAAVLQQLQAGKTPMESIASTANLIHKQLEASLSETGEKMTEITLCLGAAHLVSELIVLADAAKLYTLNNEERLQAYQLAVKKYFEDGLKNGTIDIVELQKTMEPLLNEKQRQFGMQEVQRQGLPKTPPPSQMNPVPQKQRGILGGAQNGI